MNFIQHYFEMCIPMCLGLMVLDGLYFGISGSLFGYDEPFRQIPELSVVVVGINMTLPMVTWMAFRRMHRQAIVEMSAAMGVLAVGLLLVGLLGLVARSSLASLEHALMMPIMLIPMLLHLDLYTGRGSHMGHAH